MIVFYRLMSHQRLFSSDSKQMMSLLNELVDIGNSIIITEYDFYELFNCDCIIKMGEGDGYNVIAAGLSFSTKQK